LLDNKDKNGIYQFFKNNRLNYLRLPLNPVQQERLFKYIEEVKAANELEKVETIEEVEKPPEPKTQAQINQERQAAQKATANASEEEKIVDAIQSMAYKKGTWKTDTNTANDFIAKHGKKMFDRAVELDLLNNEPGEGRLFPSNNYAYKVSTKYYDAVTAKKLTEAKEKPKAEEKPKTEEGPKEPRKGTAMYAAVLLADAKKAGNITPEQARSLMYTEMSSNVKNYTAAIEKAIADTKASKETQVEAKPSKVNKTFPAPPVVKNYFANKKELTEKPDDMADDVWEQYQRFQAGDFAMPSASFQGAEAIKKANAYKKNAEAVYEKAAREFLNRETSAKFPNKAAPKLELSKASSVTPVPIEKKISGSFTDANIKKAVYSIVDAKEVRPSLRGALLEPNKTVSTDGHRMIVIQTKNAVTAPTIVSKDGETIDSQFPDYQRVIGDIKIIAGVNAESLGNYARAVTKANKYLGNNQNPITIRMGEKLHAFNSSYIEDLTNAFRQLGYDEFIIGIEDGKMKAVSPDGKFTQIVMGLRTDNEFKIAPYNVSSGMPGYENDVKEYDLKNTIDGEAVDVSNRKLLEAPVKTLSEEEQTTLEKHYGETRNSKQFFSKLREDVIKATNEGLDAIDEAIRSIIAKIQAGVLAVAIVFNPSYMSDGNYVLMPTKERSVRIEQVRAEVPAEAEEMSDAGKYAYSIIAPTQSGKKYFTIVDKPTATTYVFNSDGSLKTASKVLLGKAFGDLYVGKVQFVQNRQTPSGMFTINAEKGNLKDYDGKTVYTLSADKGAYSVMVMHTVYTKESDGKARLNALKKPGAADSRYSHGCINGTPEFMKSINDENMDQSHMFVVPDDQSKVNDFLTNNVPKDDLDRMEVKPVTKQIVEEREVPNLVQGGQENLLATREEEIQVPKNQAQINRERQQARLAASKVADEGTFFNNFESDFTGRQLEESIALTRDEKIAELSGISRSITAATKQVAKQGSDLPIQRKLNYLLEKKESLKDQIEATKPERRSAEWFRARAAKEVAKENLSPEAMAVVDTLFAKYPNILEGLKLSVRQPNQRGVTGNFRPMERLVTVYHSSLSSLFSGKAGENQAVTMRHEITHSLEQMMTPEAQMNVIDAWADALDKAIKKYPGAAEQDFFQKVLDFVEKPTQANMKRATNAMPDISFYQYVNPSEFWAVNAEKLMKAQLGTPWARFVKGVQKIWEAIKSVFGFDNRYAIHREFNRIMNGDQQQMTRTMLADYLKQNKEEIEFLNNVEEDDALLEKYDRPDAPLNNSGSVMDKLLGGRKAAKELARQLKENPMLPVNNMVGAVDRGILYTRVKNVYFGAALDEADQKKYQGKLRDSEGFAVSSIAVTNTLHAGHIGTQVMLLGHLEFNPITQMFQAVKNKFSLANVVRIKQKLAKKVGAQRAANLIQAYFEAKRSRSIINEYLGRSAELEKLLEEQMDPTTSEDRQTKLVKEIAEAKEDFKNIQIAVDKVNMDDEQIDEFIALEDKYPELREMMDNWSSVNQNMINMMEFSGIISKQRAETLRNIKDYVPWYRIQDDAKDVHSAQGVKTLTNVGREKRFKEGKTELEIDDIVDNMIHNVMMLTRNSMRNYAANRVAMEYGERNEKGKLKVYPSEDRAKGIFNILAGGKRINIRITDPLIAESVIGLENIQIPLEGILRFMANGLRWSVTINPIFQAKQLFMDAPTAALVTGVKHPYLLWAGAFSGFARALMPQDPIVALLKSYGIGGFRSSSRAPEHELKQEIGILNKSYFSRAIKILDHVSDASDYGQRVATYRRVLAETGDQMQAIVQANNVIDFQKRGSGRTAQALTRTVSFMNAYAQQIDVLTQALAGKGLKGMKRQQALGRLAWTGGLMAGATLLYCMKIGDDEEYQKMDDQTKLRNFVIPRNVTGLDHAILLPMSTSAAFFYKAVPEMLYNKIMNEGTKNQVDNTRLRTALAKVAVDSLLGPTPFPTGLKPFAEIALDHNFFTGGSITPKGMEKLDPSRQYTNTTSELGKVVSKLTGGALNPIEADHVMRGLGGTVAAAAMWGSNLFSGNRPEAEAKSNPLYGSFIAADVPRGREDLFYDLQQRTDMALETYKDLAKKQHPKEAKEWYDEHKELIVANGFTSQAAVSLKEINAEIRRLSDLPEEKMSASEKRDRITMFKEKKNQILEQTIKFRVKAGL